MNSSKIETVVKGSLEVLDQGIRLVSCLSNEEYRHVMKPFVESCIGQHIRHVVDAYASVTKGVNTRLVDYDFRRRGALVETDRVCALSELNEIRRWMLKFLAACEAGSLNAEGRITVKSEVSFGEQSSITVPSSVLRELVFASSHAVHHYALIGIIAKLQGVFVAEDLGIAPATASHLRSNSKEDQKEDQNELACAQ